MQIAQKSEHLRAAIFTIVTETLTERLHFLVLGILLGTLLI